MRSTTLADITHLLDAEREARQRKKRRRNAQQVQAELRIDVLGRLWIEEKAARRVVSNLASEGVISNDREA